jgi:hypothetical protein
MMVNCFDCGKEYLTEADPHAWVFKQLEWRHNCGCYFIKAKEKEIQSLKSQLSEALSELKREMECVDWYAEQSSWMGYHRDVDTVASSDCEPARAQEDGFEIMLGGKRARQRIKERKQIGGI